MIKSRPPQKTVHESHIGTRVSRAILRSLLAGSLLLVGMDLPAQENGSHSGTTPRPYPDRIKWWADARFGMFIHWGPVSLTGQEISWSRQNTNPKVRGNGPIPAEVYDNLYKEFNPTQFDAEEWLRVAQRAGMGYFVFTAKHCDGFLFWPSETSDYNIAHTPFQRDVLAELSEAADKIGLKTGWYFSPPDWKDPDFRTERNDLFVERMQNQLREIMTDYGTIDLVWFDYDGGEPLYDSENTYQMVKSLQPQIIMNNRLDLGMASNHTMQSPHADYYTPEQQVAPYDDQVPWEACMTLSSSNAWAYGGPTDGVKPLDECLEMLVNCAGGDGNLLLNVGPTAEGEIPPEQVKRLEEIGAWMDKYGESIRGTRGGPFKPADYGVSTRKGNIIYLHIRDWDAEILRLPSIPAKVTGNRILSGGAAQVRQTTEGIEIEVAEDLRTTPYTTVALELDTDAIGIPSQDVENPALLTANATAASSNIHFEQPEYAPDMAIDGNPETRWATDPGVTEAWLEVDFGNPRRFSRVTIKQAFPELNRIKRYSIETFENGEWVQRYLGQSIGAQATARFEPVTAQIIRLNILESADGPTISEFQVFAGEIE